MSVETIGSGKAILPWQQMIASCSGAFLTALLMTPLDVVKTRLQAQARPAAPCVVFCNGLMDHLCACSEHKLLEPRYRHSLDAAVKIFRNEGASALWLGLPPTLVMAVPATMIYFTAYDQLKAKFAADSRVREGWAAPLAGGLSRAFAVTAISPLEMVRTKIQASGLGYKRVLSTMRESVRVEGVRSLWRGLPATLLRDVPFSMLYWTGYDWMRQQLKETSDLGPFAGAFVSGAVAGMGAAVVTTPFDVVKTHAQVRVGESIYGVKGRRRGGGAQGAQGLWQDLQRIVSVEGFSGLFVGVLPRVIKVAPACAIMISSYEMGKRFFTESM